jgi:DNA-binding NtrC family response regulator
MQPIPTTEGLRGTFARLGFVTTCRSMDPVLHCAYKAAQVSDATVLLQAIQKRGLSLPELLRRAESAVLGKALQVQGKTRREIAEMLHTSERTLYHKLNSRNVEVPTRKAG